MDIVAKQLYHENDTMRMNFSFGIKDSLYHTETETTSFWGSHPSGYPVFDIDFDMSYEENQLKMLELCDIIRKSKYFV